MSVLKRFFGSVAEPCVRLANGIKKTKKKRMVKSETRRDAETPRPTLHCFKPETETNFAKAVEMSIEHEKFRRPKILELPFSTHMSVSHILRRRTDEASNRA